MSFELEFLAEALSEWKRLDGSVRDQFKKKLAERLTEPRILSAKLFGHPNRYKIKLRTIGYRGPLSVELFNPDYAKQDPLIVARTALSKTRRLLTEALSAASG